MSETREHRIPMAFRMRPELHRRLAAAVNASPYRITTTSVIERGIELALEEMGKGGRKKTG